MCYNVEGLEAEARARAALPRCTSTWSRTPCGNTSADLESAHSPDVIISCDCESLSIHSYNNPGSPREHSLPHIMATKGSAIRDYHDQQDSQAEHPEDIPLNDLSLQYSSQSLHQPDDHDDNDDEDDRSSVQSFELYTPDEEKSLLRKLDTRLVLFLAFLYMLSFLDRSSMSIHHPNVEIRG